MSTAVRKTQNLLDFLLTTWKLNLAGAMEFRLSFSITVGTMLINNFVWVFFWGVYFTKFPLVNGWRLQDVMMAQAVGCGAYGVAAVFFGNFIGIANIVSTGQLDTYLAQPKPVLLHVLVSKMTISAIGDLLFTFILYGLYGNHSPLGFAKLLLALLVGSTIMVFFNVLAQSLSFFIGNAEGLGFQVFNAFLTVSMYPTDIFRGIGKLILFTVLPAGFISFLPIGFLRDWSSTFVWTSIAVAVGVTLLAFWVFRIGLKRYGSGNMMTMRM
ncbi:ABC-2 family transporter protein [Tumebacillus sp. ITR2]|uniref:ABC-2 family transporter protein n=1 Tax=Tumebacillus amylolyticus TaxID=2801339 RepID=A0ABS1JG99_9BACL|nr:ABC-2 family transporter protein [Tumebacillus amylolyticus]MBL0389296.1 ABC-2 family transporter protein [Tumebacillus amylolyticus]